MNQLEREAQRLDTWLWCARLVKTRVRAAALVQEGHVRINRQPTVKPHARLRPGDVLTLPLGRAVRVLAVKALAERRGPAAAASLLYEEIPEAAGSPSGEPNGRSPAPALREQGVIGIEVVTSGAGEPMRNGR